MGWFRESRKNTIINRMVEAHLFEYVMNEINKGDRHQGLWGQALVACEGDTVKAEAAYIKLRVNFIKDETRLESIIETEQLEVLQAYLNQKEKGIGQSFPEVPVIENKTSSEVSAPMQSEERQMPSGTKQSSSIAENLPAGERTIYAPDKNFETFPATISWFRTPGKIVKQGWTLCSLKTSLDVYQVKAPADLEISQIFVPNGATVEASSHKLCNIKLRQKK